MGLGPLNMDPPIDPVFNPFLGYWAHYYNKLNTSDCNQGWLPKKAGYPFRASSPIHINQRLEIQFSTGSDKLFY